MPLSIPSPLIEFILLGPSDDRRQLQDSPILGDVWVEFGRQPFVPVDLLLVPYKTRHAGTVACAIYDAIYTGADFTQDQARLACLQGFVAARLSFDQVLRIIVPKTKWWLDNWVKKETTPTQERRRKSEASNVHQLSDYNTEALSKLLTRILDAATAWQSMSPAASMHEISPFDRFVALAGLLLWAGKVNARQVTPQSVNKSISQVLTRAHADVRTICSHFAKIKAAMLKQKKDDPPLIWQVSLNRVALPAMTQSIPSVKADAAGTLFRVDCSNITWAVIDSGIDANHPAFRNPDGTGCRVKRSFDFSNFRSIVSLGNLKDRIRRVNVQFLMANKGLLHKPTNPDDDLKKLAESVRDRGPIHWELIEKFVEIDPQTKPQTHHGTHVAGIIGASKAAARLAAGRDDNDFADGMCPEISFYDFRVLSSDLKQTEFAVIAALQYIRQLNDRDNFYSIHGANLSLSIPHDVRNFACGSTPICNECTRLADSGVVVVAAAGNHGHKSFQTSEGSYELYTAFSITDPGNADSVITVGSTHRFWPHTYGVSFFSSRGPTGDGRIKPDLVAPGERIRATLPDNTWGDLDGTSMAAPHVSGAAAMLMARYPEFVGKSRRIKEILCKSATDLGRERTFQGHGMLDVLRAFQSI